MITSLSAAKILADSLQKQLASKLDDYNTETRKKFEVITNLQSDIIGKIDLDAITELISDNGTPIIV